MDKESIIHTHMCTPQAQMELFSTIKENEAMILHIKQQK